MSPQLPTLKLTAKVLLQFEGKPLMEVGDVEIPINVSTAPSRPSTQFHPGVRGGFEPTTYSPPPPAPSEPGGIG